ncbi:hypothetical protein BD310DRAFT_936969 [Dichomitus squalens]|uniref:Uncharacterized protein n=1 Tax=Dichomitus squalens TaxID=114155 RepID=A0A4Q9PIN8_9APHY|nr:hypothetical protein BD310DRAFT_936969 [Dichomitus squalens]
MQWSLVWTRSCHRITSYRSHFSRKIRRSRSAPRAWTPSHLSRPDPSRRGSGALRLRAASLTAKAASRCWRGCVSWYCFLDSQGVGE